MSEFEPNQGQSPGDGEADQDVHLAKALARYVDHLARGEEKEAEGVFHLHPELQPEFEALKIVETLVEDEAEPLDFRDFRIIRNLPDGGMGTTASMMRRPPKSTDSFPSWCPSTVE